MKIALRLLYCEQFEMEQSLNDLFKNRHLQYYGLIAIGIVGVLPEQIYQRVKNHIEHIREVKKEIEQIERL